MVSYTEKSDRLTERVYFMYDERENRESKKVSSGPLRILNYEGKLFVTGFGLWIHVESEKEGLDLIRELENQGYRICC